MPDSATLATFVAASLVLLVTPGPAVLYIVARSLEGGRLAGVVSSLGLSTGGLAHVAAATFGAAALLAASPLAFHALRLGGAAYLIWLGIKTLARRRRRPREDGAPAAASLAEIYRDGVVVNLLNPKAMLFLFAFVPQFADPARGPIARQILGLGLLFVALGMATDLAYALTAGSAGRWLRRDAGTSRIGRWLSGAVYLTLGVAAALFAGRPQQLPGNPPGGDPPLALVGGTLWDGSGGAPVADAVVVVSDGRIAAAGRRGEVVIPPDAERIDAGGATLLPGLVDLHVHLTTRLAGDDDPLGRWLAAGFTTLADMGSGRSLAELRRQVADRPGPVPRVLFAGPIWTAPDGYPFARPGSSAREIVDAAKARDAVEEVIAAERPDLVKAAFERGFLADVDDPGWPLLDPATLVAVATAARGARLPAAAHVTQAGELAAVVEAGFRIVAHTPSSPLPGPLLREAARRGVTFVTTIDLWEEPQRLATACDNLVRYLAAGGRVAFGTDGPAFSEPGFPRLELERLAGCGLAPEAILLALTRDAASAVGGEADFGTIAPGMAADLVVVEGDPLADPRALERVRLVIRAGEVVRVATPPHSR